MTPTKAKRQTTTEYPDLLALSTVEVDHARSNPYAEVFRVRSDRHETTVYDVIFYPRESRWACNCPAANHPSCKHRIRAAVLREARWFEGLLADCAPDELRAMVPAKQQQVRTECDALSGHACLLVIESLLLCADEPLVAA
jgi:hypothetical protein